MEGDCYNKNRKGGDTIFQSTPSAWRETFLGEQMDDFLAFQSTPSAWRETWSGSVCRSRRRYFNPLPPHGGRRLWHKHFGIPEHFNPLPPHGGRHGIISVPVRPRHFNPLPPHGGRPVQLRHAAPTSSISIHFLRMEGDPFGSLPFLVHKISIHSLRMEGDSSSGSLSTAANISIHSLRMEGDKIS